jgi:protein involved in polysaccharide export with SLBB domain
MTAAALLHAGPGNAQVVDADSSFQASDARSVSPETTTPSLTGPVRLMDSDAALANTRNSSATLAPARMEGQEPRKPAQRYIPSEFERFVNQLAQGSTPIRRFGSELVTGANSQGQDYVPQVPPEYLISPGDEVDVTLWGTVDGHLRRTVDRSGRINLPRVGSIMVAGVRYADLSDVIHAQAAQIFKNFQVSATLGKLRSIRIYVTGFTPKPGSYTVSSLSTIVNALMETGGPSAAGSFRDIELYRAGKLVSTFDLYKLLLQGDKSADRVLQAEDVIQIGPVGKEVALIGSVNKPAVFELKPGETVADVLRMAGGLDTVADRTRLAVQHLADRDTVRIAQLSLPADAGREPSNGDVLQAFSLVDTALPLERQNKRVRVDGEVQRPGDYLLPPGSTIADALKRAGGLTPQAYVFGTELDRDSVRVTQQQNYDSALRDMETDFARASASVHAQTADEVAAQSAKAQNTERLIAQLRAVKPTGRVVLEVTPSSSALPELPLEQGDHLYVPPRPSTVGVFGSAFSTGSFLYTDGKSINDYLNLAGGPKRDADKDSIFVVRANGTVVSNAQSSGWFGLSSSFGSLTAQPGDTIFVPEQMDRTTFLQVAKDWAQILYQFGLGAAALKTIRQ